MKVKLGGLEVPVGLRDRLKAVAKQAIGRPSAAPAPRSSVLPTAPDAQGFTAVVAVDGLVAGRGSTYRVGEHNVALFHVGDRWLAIDDACAHEDGPLGEGSLEGTVVTCPYHNWRYDVSTGACLTEPERRQACYATKVADGFVWVGRVTTKGTRARGGEHDDGLKTVLVD